jgi:hypothetical protein
VATDALLLALSKPPIGNEQRFNQWYDAEHAPARLTVPGIRTARRYRDVEPERGYLAYYDVDSMAVFDDPAYRKLPQQASAEEREMMASAQLLDRRVYERLATPAAARADDLGVCGEYLLCVWWTPPEDAVADFHAWYSEEHLPMLMEVPGWLRARRFRLIDGGGQAFLAMHDLASDQVFDQPAHDAAVSTPWRDRVVQARLGYDRRLYRLWRRLD